MNDYRINKEPKEVTRNKERKSAIMKIASAFAGMIERASEISHNSAKQKTKNFTDWLVGTTDGITDMIVAESNYSAYDEAERKELETKKTEE